MNYLKKNSLILLSCILILASCSKKSIKLPPYDQYWKFASAKSTLQKFNELLPLAQKNGDAKYLAGLYTQLARANAINKNFDKAKMFLKRADSLITTNMKEQKIRYLLENGRLNYMLQDVDLADSYLNNAFELANSNSFDFYAVDAADMLARIRPQTKKMWLTKSIDIAKTSNDSIVVNWVPRLKTDLAVMFFENQEFEKSSNLLKQVLNVYNKKNNLMGKIRTTWVLGKSLRHEKKYKQAIKLLSNTSKLDKKNATILDAYIFIELAKCYQKIDDKKNALAYFEKAWTILNLNSAISKKDKQELYETIKSLKK